MTTVSVIVPVFDEQDTIGPLTKNISQVFEGIPPDDALLAELIFVDDGSRDGTWENIQAMAHELPVVCGIRFRRNFGKAAALQEGIQEATGDIIITMDGDLQDDPREIPRFLAALNSGLDVVSCWKKNRRDPLGKTLPSKLFNYVTAKVSGVPIHDFNCGFKAYRREIFHSLDLYGELHRFIPALADAMGYRVGEVEVEHHPRRFGTSKYGVGRLIKGFLDLLTVVTITRFNSRPGHLFGGLGILVGAIGLAAAMYLSVLWLAGYPIGQRPLLSFSVLLSIMGLQFVLFGMMAELLNSTRRPATVRNIIAERARSPTRATNSSPPDPSDPTKAKDRAN